MARDESLPDASATRTRFAGSLADVSIGDLFQTLEMAAKSSQIEFDTDIGGGTVWFHERSVIDAECGGLTGAEAIYRLAMADDGTFVARFRESDHPARIQTSPQRLLMEAARRRDEWLDRAGEGLRPATRLALKPGARSAARATLDDDDDALLDRLDGDHQLVDLIPAGDGGAAARFKQLRALEAAGLLTVVAPPAGPSSSLMASDAGVLATPALDFWASAFLTYVLLDKTPRRALLRIVALNVMIISAVLGVAWWSGRVLLGGQLLGWALLMVGHATTSFPQLPFERPLLVLCEPLVLIADMLDRTGVKIAFVGRGRALARRADA